MARGRLTGPIILGLLACNTVYYVAAGRFSVALESLAWYALLILFALEGTRGRWRPGTLTLVHAVRALATFAIAATAVLYVQEKEWLDAANLLLWIGVVVVLEIQLRLPARAAVHARAFARAAALLYTGLGALALVWLARGDWMDAWDAALWLCAFALLELGLLHHEKNLFKNNNLQS